MAQGEILIEREGGLLHLVELVVKDSEYHSSTPSDDPDLVSDLTRCPLGSSILRATPFLRMTCPTNRSFCPFSLVSFFPSSVFVRGGSFISSFSTHAHSSSAGDERRRAE